MLDAAVIGAGHNGLVAAAYLARAGRPVEAFERRDLVGGACVIDELWPGDAVTGAPGRLAARAALEDLGAAGAGAGAAAA